ncbi:hypothetical protein MAPG_09195 [Magnaporthiopsis poae ATCC 64411]|uniref:Uncharacterized protein n=1 Tax=Magnaporthiopsis poae (strain ATCC 64411 / 73-15) TaxID=644358 RepID=A0A0C4E9B5_MAGP6|nr:hypothetical protein MAPG_09195 [Magnaporthiopsis poae ATCC 64411]
MVVQARRSAGDRRTAHRKDETISDAKILRAVREVLDRLDIRLAAASEQPSLSRRSNGSGRPRASSTAAPSRCPPRPRREQRDRSGSRHSQRPSGHHRSVQSGKATERDPASHRSPERNHAAPSEPPQPIPQTRPLAADYERSVLELRRSFGLLDSQSDLGRPSSPANGEVAASPRRQSVLEVPPSTGLQGDLEPVSVYSPCMTRSDGGGLPMDRCGRAKSPTPAPAAVATTETAVTAPEPIFSGLDRTKPVVVPTPEAGILPQELGTTAPEPAAPTHEPAGVHDPAAVRVRRPRPRSRDQSSRSSRRRHCASRKKLGRSYVTGSNRATHTAEVVPECLDAVVLLVENCRQSVALRMSATRFFLRGMWASRSA